MNDEAEPGREWRRWGGRLKLYRDTTGDQSPVSAVIYTHSHVDQAQTMEARRCGQPWWLMLARSGDKAGGIAHATTAMNALPPEKHSLTLRMLLAEIQA
ncbi:hypothetical protein [Streptomyces sp. A1547]|uniref:hypothetical protein n=1 Tax=Streptomyces sp. A1547 TaxID=2563105 RepID=UPI0026D9956F